MIVIVFLLIQQVTEKLKKKKIEDWKINIIKKIEFQKNENNEIELNSKEYHRLSKFTASLKNNSSIDFFGNETNFQEIFTKLWDFEIHPNLFNKYKAYIKELTPDQVDVYTKEKIEKEIPIALRAKAMLRGKTPDWYMGFSNEFVKSISKIDRKKQGRILDAISSIASSPIEPRGDTVKPLTGDKDGLWRYRLGDDRLLYFPDKVTKHVTLLSFSPRGEVYNK